MKESPAEIDVLLADGYWASDRRNDARRTCRRVPRKIKAEAER